MLRWLYLDLNSYFASVEQQLDPRLRGLPIAVGPERIDSGTIIAASYEAKAFGIKTGMKVGEARRRCPGLIFTGGDHGRYAAFHEKIVAEVWKHIPVTHICSIDEVACRLLDNESSPEQAAALARRIKAGIRANVGECLTSSVGIAPSRLLAKIAADMQKPDGLTMLEQHQLPEALFPLPLRDIPGIGAKMEARLQAR
ncbi:MAG: DNA polymerase Y family protein, partial [Sandaracinobacteroides sp.]